MKCIFILGMLLSLAACEKTAEQHAYNPYLDASQADKDAYQARMDEKYKIVDLAEQRKQTEKQMAKSSASK